MQQVIGNVMPFALGIAISPIPVIAVILMLITPKARSNGLAFLVGWVAGLLVIGGAALAVAAASGLSDSTDTASQASVVLDLVLGLLLLLLAFRQWRARPRPGDDARLPKWMQSLDAFTPGKSLAVGALLSGINPKNLALNLAAMSVIASAGLAAAEQAVALIIVVLIASASIIAPVVVYLAGGERSEAVLAGWKAWLSQHNAAIMTVLLALIGVVLLGQGIAGL